MNKKVILDTTCLIALEKLNLFNLLSQLYSKVLVPPQVVKEFSLTLPDFIQIRKVKDIKLLKVLMLELGKGEAEVIALALEEGDCIIVLDDKKARKIAKDLNLKVTGTLGVLLKAKKLGLIEAIYPLLQELKKKNFYISEKLERNVLKLSEELDN